MDVLEISLREQLDMVDHIFIVESTITHKGVRNRIKIMNDTALSIRQIIRPFVTVSLLVFIKVVWYHISDQPILLGSKASDVGEAKIHWEVRICQQVQGEKRIITTRYDGFNSL